MNVSVNVDLGRVQANLEQYNERVHALLGVVGQTVGAKMESHAKNNARWTDRTHAARAGLKYNSAWQGTTLDIAIMHSVDYGIWLELRDFAYAGRLDILLEARDSQVQTFINMVKKVIG